MRTAGSCIPVVTTRYTGSDCLYSQYYPPNS